MKKIDLHIHTIPSISDSPFEFSLDKLKEYINTLLLDCIAITNHNLFNIEQFREIQKELDIVVLPGIEINLDKGHLLLISDNDELEDFNSRCQKVFSKIKDPKDYISVEDLQDIFSDLNKYLLIPHYTKKPVISPETINELKDYIIAGEVTSPKKFKYCVNDEKSLTPLLFSDLRIKKEMKHFSSRQTFVNINEISVKSLNACFEDKSKVALSKEEGTDFFQFSEDGKKLSTGLNVILGQRSSGKSYTLDYIFKNFENVKYIKQFELLEKDEEQDKKRFNQLLSTKQNTVSETFLKEFKTVLDDIIQIDWINNEHNLEEYLNSLIEVAKEEERKDVYSNCKLFNESLYNESSNESLRKLIIATEELIINKEYKSIINKHVSENNLKLLICDLITKYREEKELNYKKLWINSIVANIKSELSSNTAFTSIPEFNFYSFQFDRIKLRKFDEVAKLVKAEKIVTMNNVRRFKIIAEAKEFKGAQELLDKCGRKTSFRNAFDNYTKPLKFLDELKKIEILPETDYYKYFVDIQYKILNEHGVEVSGGERSEFNLLEKIQDAFHYDMLLIDEPESSFDNLFLKNEVNEQIKEISKSIPVIIVTHNNTVGASILPDYILYTKKSIIDKQPVFEIYSGYPSDKFLKSVCGKEISNYDIMLNCLEAGNIAYNKRNKSYEKIKN